MDICEKLLIDIEEKNQAVVYYFKPESEVVLAGENIVTIPKNQQDLKVYKLLEEICRNTQAF